jgi:hypothetical protein
MHDCQLTAAAIWILPHCISILMTKPYHKIPKVVLKNKRVHASKQEDYEDESSDS